jgi:hypothetical protein
MPNEAVITAGRRRCDARCYDGGKDGKCKCICQGINHGVGLEKAKENTQVWMFGENDRREENE